MEYPVIYHSVNCFCGYWPFHMVDELLSQQLGIICGISFLWASGQPMRQRMLWQGDGPSSIGAGGFPGHLCRHVYRTHFKGRTIREFMVGVMSVPTTIAFFWLCMFGGNAIWQELNASGGPGAVGGVIETVEIGTSHQLSMALLTQWAERPGSAI